MARSLLVEQALRAAGRHSRKQIRAAFGQLADYAKQIEKQRASAMNLSRLKGITSLSDMRDALADVGGSAAYRMTPKAVRRAFRELTGN